MANRASVTLRANTTWTAPAGVTKVELVLKTLSIKTGTEVGTEFMNNAGNVAAYWIMQDGKVFAVGQNTNTRLGDGTTTAAKSVPVLVLGNLIFKKICTSTAGNMVVGLVADGKAYCWGDNNAGQLGDGTIVQKSSPVLVVGGYFFNNIATCGGTNYGLTAGGQIYSWGGSSPYGMLGDGTLLTKSSPVLVVGGQTWASLFSRGNQGAWAVNTAGQLYGWGRNDDGRLGVGDLVARSSPTLVVGGITGWTKIMSINGGTMGLTNTGLLYSWGVNTSGRLGTNDLLNRSSPTLVVGGITDWVNFELRGNAAMGLRSNGVLYGWGSNANGQVGDSSTADKSSPVLVVGNRVFSRIASGGSNSAAITTAGDLYTWGNNGGGQLGDNTTAAARSSPVLVVGGLNWAEIQADGSGFYGFTSNGLLYGWGTNGNGELGQNDTVARSSPVLVARGGFNIEAPAPIVTHVQVVPGASYAVNLLQSYAAFGQYFVGPGPAESLTINYTQ